MRILAYLLVISFATGGCKTEEQSNVLKLAHGLDRSHPVHKGMAFMAKRVDEISKGKLQVQIYPSGQLGSEQQCVELLQIGSLAITKISAAVMESFVEDYKVLGLPYIFLSKEHSFEVLDGPVGKELLEAPVEYRIKGLCFYDAGSRSFYTASHPILSPDDLKGMKIRVMKSITAINMIKAMGGSPTPISYGELYTALQSGVVDGAENNPPSFYFSRHYEVCKHYSLNEHTMIPDVLAISTVVWNKLSDQEKKWLMQAVDESVIVQRELWKEAVEESLSEIKKNGVEIYYPDKMPFAEKVEEVFDIYKDKPKLYRLIEKIRATKVE
ncbi:MAG: TRAP transporter substrate-binding protein [Bacteroidales bacterium]